MDAPRFDAWTRRRVGFAASGLAAAVLGVVTRERVAAKKKKKKIRCRKLLQGCEPDSKEESCCQGLNCDPVAGEGLLCCLGRRQGCQSSAQCCGDTLCNDVAGLVGNRCCGSGGAFCAGDFDCCGGAQCIDSTCVFASDRALKANVGAVDPADMLRRVRELPIATWSDTGDDRSVPHIGPMAQDFAALFRLGADDRRIHPIDGQGVALAAIQGLVQEIEALSTENTRLAARVVALEPTS